MMSVISYRSCIECSFESKANISANFPLNEIEVYYGITKDLCSEYSNLENYLTQDERLRADKFHFIEDRNTYISCHGLLRSILSKKLKKNPLEIIFLNDKNNKPGLIGNPLYFNITHVRNAFAFVISKHFYVGIDMENADQSIDFIPIINTFFSNEERKFILGSQADAQERFFLLWTRKEALLKAIGTGIITNLPQIEVSEKENIIYKKSFDNLICDSVYNEHFIYSEKVLNYYLSIAIPQKAEIILNQLKEENFKSYFD